MNIYRGINGGAPVPALIDRYLYGLEYTYYHPYTRYWHGFLIIIKPLLEFFSLYGIRIINGIAQAALTLINYLYLMPVALACNIVCADRQELGRIIVEKCPCRIDGIVKPGFYEHGFLAGG